MSELNKEMNIFQRISEIMKDVEYFKKDKTVGNGSMKYKAVTEEKVTKSVRQSMIKNGVVIIPVEQTTTIKEHGKTKSGATNLLTQVETKYRVQNIYDKEDYIIAVSSGQGVDTQDKSVGKAMTYAYKYMLLRTLAIPTGEDPDQVASTDIDERLKNGFANKDQVDELKSLLKTIKSSEKEFLNKCKVLDFEDLLFDVANEKIKSIKSYIQKNSVPTVDISKV